MLTWNESKINITEKTLTSGGSNLSLISIHSKENTKWPNICVSMYIPANMTIQLTKNSLEILEKERGITNTIKSKINSFIKGLEESHSLKISLTGVGYNLEQKNEELLINIGYKNSVKFKIPDNILIKSIEINKNGNYELTAESFDLELLTQWLHKIRQLKPSYKDKYKGKGFSDVLVDNSQKTV